MNSRLNKALVMMLLIPELGMTRATGIGRLVSALSSDYVLGVVASGLVDNLLLARGCMGTNLGLAGGMWCGGFGLVADLMVIVINTIQTIYFVPVHFCDF
jgi:hypothetical protein